MNLLAAASPTEVILNEGHAFRGRSEESLFKANRRSSGYWPQNFHFERFFSQMQEGSYSGALMVT